MKLYFSAPRACVILLAGLLTHCHSSNKFSSVNRAKPASENNADVSSDSKIDSPGAEGSGTQAPPPTQTPTSVNAPKPGFRIAYLGDQGDSADTVAVLQLIKAQKADLVVIAGDYDYSDNPDAWDTMLTDNLGASYPVIAAIGNHDTSEWAGYKAKLEARLAKMKDIKCEGDTGVNQTCTVKGITVVLSGIGTMGADHEAYMDAQLKKSVNPWRVCAWHKNQNKMQAGDKSDEVGWLAYETCRNNGAMIATGHEHSYERTFLLSNFEAQTIVSKDSNLVLEPGKSFAFVSGLGGKEVRDQNSTGEWWAKIYTSAQQATFGAVFCDYNVDNDPRKAKCEFKTINNQTADSWTMVTKLPLQ